ncbi:ribokinase, partial [Carnobacterium sp.]|uniref:ribokinase n=1 Tax=Carnobacterium sp. TaxID=48221 RepID=UPI0028A892F1
KVGADIFGEQILTQLVRENLDVEHIVTEKNQPTGIASITKATGDNSIVVISGANACTDVQFVEEKSKIIAGSKVLLVQLEIPVVALKEALKIAETNGVITILNPAPYTKDLIELLPYVDYLTPNETEFLEIVSDFHEPSYFEKDLLLLSEKIHPKIIITRGENGVSFVENNQVLTIPAISVNVEDTTGAGDTFNGILASSLAQKQPLMASVKLAALGASISVEKEGAQSGMPTIEELNIVLASIEK